MSTHRIHPLLHALGLTTAIVGGCTDRDLTSGSSGGGSDSGSDGGDTDDSASSTSGASASGTGTTTDPSTTGPGTTTDSSSTTSDSTGNTKDPKFDIGGLGDLHVDPCPLPEWAAGCNAGPEPGHALVDGCVPMDASCTECDASCFEFLENDCVCADVQSVMDFPCGFLEENGACCTVGVVDEDATVCACLTPTGSLLPPPEPSPDAARAAGAPSRDEILRRLDRDAVLPADVRARLKQD